MFALSSNSSVKKAISNDGLSGNLSQRILDEIHDLLRKMKSRKSRKEYLLETVNFIQIIDNPHEIIGALKLQCSEGLNLGHMLIFYQDTASAKVYFDMLTTLIKQGMVEEVLLL